MNISKQRGRKVQTFGRKGIRGLAAGGSLGDSLINKSADAFELHRSDNGSDINRLVERRPDAQILHAPADLLNQRFGNALLHQQA